MRPSFTRSDPHDIVILNTQKARASGGFVPLYNFHDRHPQEMRGSAAHPSEDEGDLQSHYKEDSVQPPRHLQHDFLYGEHSRSLVPSLKLINNDMRNKDLLEFPGPFDNDPGSICYLESDHEFLPDFEPADTTLNFVFTPSQTEGASGDDALLRKVKAWEDWRERGDTLEVYDPMAFQFFRVIRPPKRAPNNPTVSQLQEKIEQINLTKEKSRHASEIIEEEMPTPRKDQVVTLKTNSLSSTTQGSTFLPHQQTPFDGRRNPQVPHNTPTLPARATDSRDECLGPLAPPPTSDDRPACRCKKTNCLKLYCECFLKGNVCGIHCKCVDCMNSTDYQQVREMLLEDHFNKGTIAYDPNTQTIDQSAANTLKRQRSCTCAKTGCNKKYCECFRFGSRCSADCKCKGCKNGNEGRKDDDVDRLGPRKQIKKRRSHFLNTLIEKMKRVDLVSSMFAKNNQKN
jgi:hypothetical protein